MKQSEKKSNASKKNFNTFEAMAPSKISSQQLNMIKGGNGEDDEEIIIEDIVDL